MKQAFKAIQKKIKEAFQDSHQKEKISLPEKPITSPLDPSRTHLLSSLQAKLRINFQDVTLLNLALTHPSYPSSGQSPGETKDNARLEFLGDSVLGLVVSHLLYRENRDADEGKLTKWKSHLVSTKFLAGLAESLQLAKFLQVGEYEKRNPVFSPSVLAATFESVLGALYLDSGFDSAFKFLEKLFHSHLKILEGEEENPKGLLQEALQKKYKEQPYYSVVDEYGPSHTRMFEVQVVFRGKVFGSGKGRSKKEAEKEAAYEALKILGKD
jgi:ribonuclease-3